MAKLRSQKPRINFLGQCILVIIFGSIAPIIRGCKAQQKEDQIKASQVQQADEILEKTYAIRTSGTPTFDEHGFYTAEMYKQMEDAGLGDEIARMKIHDQENEHLIFEINSRLERETKETNGYQPDPNIIQAIPGEGISEYIDRCFVKKGGEIFFSGSNRANHK